MPKGEKPIRDYLQGDLLTQINEIWRKGKSTYQGFQQGDTNQDWRHCEAVEDNLSKLIPDERKGRDFKPLELFVLSASACLHDIGKVVKDDIGSWSEDHGVRGGEIILKKYSELGLGRDQRIPVAYVVGVHNHGRMDELPTEPVAVGIVEVDVLKLAPLFRLADMLDTCCQRAPEVVSGIKYPLDDIPSKWRGRQAINGWYLDKEDNIILQAVPRNQEEMAALYQLKEMMQEGLASITPYLKYFRLPRKLGKLDIKSNVFLVPELQKKATSDRPFPGMAYYTQDEVAIFKGRNEEVSSLLSLVCSYPISLLIGESGSGKTSLIHAGLFPELESIGWVYVWVRPFDDPKLNIGKGLWSAFFEGEFDSSLAFLDILKRAVQRCKPHPLLVVMDQFEDILSCPQEILDDFSYDLMAVQTGTVIPNLKVLLSFREDAIVKLNSRLLKRVTGSARQLPSVELERLSRLGAQEALLAGLRRVKFGLDPRQESGQKPLLDSILDDLFKGNDQVYPPYLQMVAETLCKRVDKNNPVISRAMYFEELKGTDEIIADYLIGLLEEFGDQKTKAERILVFLTSSTGKKAQRSLSELSQATEIEQKELSGILKKMVDLRMVRALGEDELEIIHDHLGKLVDEKLVKPEDRTVKYLQEMLNSYYQHYRIYKVPITEETFLAMLYRDRKKITVSKEYYPLMVCTCLHDREDYGHTGLGWFWLKDETPDKIRMLVKELIPNESVGNQAKRLFLQTATRDDWDEIIWMLKDKCGDVRHAANIALAKIAVTEDKDELVAIIQDEDEDSCVRQAAVKALGKIAGPQFKDKLYDMSIRCDEDSHVRYAATEALAEIVCPADWDRLARILWDEDKSVCRAAIGALAKIAAPGDWDKVMVVLKSLDRDLRGQAAEILIKIANHWDWDNLVVLLKYEDEPIRRTAAEALAKIAVPEDWDNLVIMLNDQEIRQVAADILIKIAVPENRNKYVAMLNNDITLRQVAIEALAKIDDPRDWDRLVTMLEDANDIDRQTIYMALVKMSSHKGWDILVQTLRGNEFRMIAANTLIKIASSGDREKLIAMIGDGNSYVREVAVEALGKIAGPEDKDLFIRMVHDDYSDVRFVALEVLQYLLLPNDREALLDLLADEVRGFSEKHHECFSRLSYLDHDLYCQILPRPKPSSAQGSSE